MAVIHVGQREALTVSDAAALLEVSPQHVRDLVRRQKLRQLPVDGPILIDRASVADYRQHRGHWNRCGVRGGRAAAERLGVWEGSR